MLERSILFVGGEAFANGVVGAAPRSSSSSPETREATQVPHDIAYPAADTDVWTTATLLVHAV